MTELRYPAAHVVGVQVVQAARNIESNVLAAVVPPQVA